MLYRVFKGRINNWNYMVGVCHNDRYYIIPRMVATKLTDIQKKGFTSLDVATIRGRQQQLMQVIYGCIV